MLLGIGTILKEIVFWVDQEASYMAEDDVRPIQCCGECQLQHTKIHRPEYLAVDGSGQLLTVD